MTQTRLLIRTLKQQLRRNGRTYADVARVLELSEASVKRLFAEQNLTLQRLESIGQLLGMTLGELVRLAEEQAGQTEGLTPEQEREILQDPQLLVIALSALNGYRLQDMLQQYRLEETTCIRLLIRLDRIGLLELLPDNRIRLRVSPNFRWQPGGPIQRFFLQQVAAEFFRSDFSETTEQLLVLNGLLSQAGNQRWQQRLNRLAEEFNECCQAEGDLPLEQRFGSTCVLALRQWQYGPFAALDRQRPGR